MDFCVCVCFCLCMCEFTCFCGWVNSNMHCTLFYSDPTRRHKQRAQPHLIICNGNSLHYHNILFQQTFRFPGGRPIGDKNGASITETLPMPMGSVRGVLGGWKKEMQAYSSQHMTGHMLRPPCSLCSPCLYSRVSYRMQTSMVSIEDFFNVAGQGWRGKRKAGKQSVLICMHFMLALCHVFVSVSSRVWEHVGVSSTSREKCCSLKNYIISNL